MNEIQHRRFNVEIALLKLKRLCTERQMSESWINPNSATGDMADYIRPGIGKRQIQLASLIEQVASLTMCR